MLHKCLNHHDHLVDPKNLLGNLIIIQNWMKNIKIGDTFSTFLATLILFYKQGFINNTIKKTTGYLIAKWVK